MTPRLRVGLTGIHILWIKFDPRSILRVLPVTPQAAGATPDVDPPANEKSRRVARVACPAHPRARRLDGRAHLLEGAERSGLSRRALQEPSQAAQELHRSAGLEPTKVHRRNTPRVSRGRRRHH